MEKQELLIAKIVRYSGTVDYEVVMVYDDAKSAVPSRIRLRAAGFNPKTGETFRLSADPLVIDNEVDLLKCRGARAGKVDDVKKCRPEFEPSP